MDKKVLILSFFLLFAVLLRAQKDDPAVATINGQSISLSEFKAALYKDGIKKTKPEIRDFLETYIDYKLNVMEGRYERLDTTERYKRDLQSARILISKSYARDTTPQMLPYIENIYNRMQEDIELNHVVLKFDKKRYFPSDTLALYNQAVMLRKKLLKEGFAGAEYIDNTQSPAVLNDIENSNGYIGWVTPLMLSPSVAKVACNIPIGDISMPIRSSEGYHIIQVLEKRKALGAYKIDMVPFFFPEGSTSSQKDSVRREVEDIYRSITTDYSFDDLCASYLTVLNDDTKSCSIGYVNYNSPFPANFISAVFKLKKIGEVSQPLETNNGYCLIRLADIKTMPPYSIDVQNDILSLIKKSKYLAEYSSVMNTEYTHKFDLKVNNPAYLKLENIANNIYPEDTLFLKKVDNLDSDLFIIGDKRTYKVRNFAYYIDALARMALPDPDTNAPPTVTMKEAVDVPLSTDRLALLFDRYTTASVRLYADSTLEDRIPELKSRMQAIGDELVAYEVLDKHMLQPSISDKAGLQAYFADNKAKYTWADKRFKGFILYSNDKRILEKTKLLIKEQADAVDISQLVKNAINNQSGLVFIEQGIWKEGDNALVDFKMFNRKGSLTLPDGFTEFDVVGRYVNAPESYSDVKSEVENDYMEYLRSEWYKKLREKYAVKINDSVLKKIK